MLRAFLTRTSCLGRYAPSLPSSSSLSTNYQRFNRSYCQSNSQAGESCSSSPATPSKLYSKTHQYLIIDENKLATVGMTPHGQHSLGDVVYLELPEPGTSVAQSDCIGTLESVKAASDLYAPLSGTITETNPVLQDQPKMINKDPEGRGWMYKMQLSENAELSSLISHEEYKTFTGDS